MGRPKEYEREKVLEAATQVFWEKGYQGTSVGDLVEGTGLHRRSMYEEFGDKDGLFESCLDHYVLKTGKVAAAILVRQPLGFGNIEAFLRNRVEYTGCSSFKGCLIVKSAIDQEMLTARARKKVQSYLAGNESAFYDCLIAAREKGEIHKNADCRALAKYLMCFLEGMMVMGQTNPTKKELQRVLDKVLLSARG